MKSRPAPHRCELVLQVISRLKAPATTLGTRLALVLGLVLGLWTGPAAAEEKRLVGPQDVFRLEYAADPRIAPDGRQVVYRRDIGAIESDRFKAELWLVDVASGESRPLTDGQDFATSPRFSPDGGRLAFLSDRSGRVQIHVLDLASGTVVQLTRGTLEPRGIAWSPDGREMAFLAREPFSPKPLVDLPEPPPGAKWAPPPREIRRLRFRIDGEGYVEPGVVRIFLVPATGGEVRRATRDTAQKDESSRDLLNHHRDDDAPVWTPDGRYLLVSANRRDDANREPLDSEIYEVDLAAGTLRPLTDRHGPDVLPAVSPDGEHIAYLGFDDRRLSYQPARLYVARRDGSDRRPLTTLLDRDVSSPRFTADGRAVMILTTDQGQTKIARVGLDGRLKTLPGSVGDGWSAYGGGSFTVARNGLVAFPATGAALPSEVALTSTELEAARALTDINADFLAARRLAEVEEISFQAPDGRPIQGWVVHPPPGSPGDGPRPLILDIHGGPHRDYGPRFDLEKQLWAARGYAVLYTNPRGSIGYGARFGNLIHRTYPGKDVDDLEAAVDAVVARGVADPEELFVTGGSGGALLAFSLITRSDRFRAAVGIYPLANWTSFVLTSDLSALVMNRWFPGPPWEHAEHYRARSPLFGVGEIDTPTLLLLGEEDHRTPPFEAEQLFTALKYRGVETALVRLPGESHFSEIHPSHYMARILYTVGWFDRHRRDTGPDPEVQDAGGEPP